MRHWLMKSEPGEFSIDDLVRARGQTTPWVGVRNYQARNFMRDEMRVGDRAFFYHSSCPEPGIAGIVEISRLAYPDETQFDPKSAYYDPKATRDAFTEKISTFIELITTQIRNGSGEERRRRAIAIYGMMVGTLQIARAVNDRKLSDEILESGISAALALAGEETATPA